MPEIAIMYQVGYYQPGSGGKSKSSCNCIGQEILNWVGVMKHGHKTLCWVHFLLFETQRATKKSNINGMYVLHGLNYKACIAQPVPGQLRMSQSQAAYICAECTGTY